MKSLSALYASHTGKVTDKWGLYLDVYDRLFASRRDDPVTLVEVGVQNGGSLEIWPRFFANGVAFIGCDIDPGCRALTFDDARLSVIVGDANSSAVHQAIRAKAPSWDIFIDDGSHTSHDIIASFCNYFPWLRPGGLHIIEDLHCSYWPKFGGGIWQDNSSMEFLKLLADINNHHYWKEEAGLDDLLAPFFPDAARPNAALFADLFSVAFYDSLCVIEKRAKGQVAGLGPRVIVGEQALVSRDPLDERERALPL
jgi:hypothetical protein